LQGKHAKLQRQVDLYRRTLMANNIVVPDHAALYAQYVAETSGP
jgi:hypothetical protein